MIYNSKVFREEKKKVKLDGNVLIPILLKKLYRDEIGINSATYANAMKEVRHYDEYAVSK